KSLAIYEQTLGTLNPKVGFSMINLARSKAEQNRFNEAETLIKKADQLWLELYGDFDNPNKAFTHAVLGQIVEGNGDIDRSLLIQQEALQLYIRIYGAKHPDVANQYQLIGKLHRKNGDVQEAIFAFQEAIYANLPGQQFKSVYDLPTLNSYFHPDYLLSAIMDKATTLEALHFDKTLRARELTAAISTYELADQLLNEIRRYRINEIDKLRLGETSRQVYESSIKLLDILGSQPFQAKKYYPQIFDFIEKSKASVLLQAIQDTKAASYAGLPESILAEEDSLKSQIAYYQQRVAEDGKDQEAIDWLFSYQTTYRDFISQLEKDYPAYYDLKHSSRDVSISEISSTLPVQTTIIQYFLGKENLTITWLHQGSVKTEMQPIDEQLAKDIAGFRNSIKHNIRKVFESTASHLYDILIPTLDPSITELILIPDGILNTVPFEALFDIEDDTYLIERYAISYSFAAAIATTQMQKVKNDNGDILLMAPVNFNHTSNKLPSLPATEQEVRRLSVLFRAKGFSATTYVKNKAVESRLNSEELGSYSYLHFATHGEVNQSSPELSKIYLSAEEGQDGSLYSGEIYNLKLNARLVSLSACETGLGKIAQGEGIVGLSRALIYAGADNLVVSLWKVSDQATTEMMSEFYNSHLFSSSPGFTSSLRAAKLSLISSEQYKAPYYWAPFILIGY
ncbi:MAG: CHAT domain-containing protein, partial [Cyclobacteriaceae bacterium]